MSDKQALSDRPHTAPQTSGFLTLSIEVVLGMVLSVASFLFFIEIAEHVLASSLTVDTDIAQYIHTIRTPTLTTLMQIVTMFGSEIVLLPAAIAFILLTRKKHKREAVLFAVILAMAFLVNVILKLVVHRARPGIDPLLDIHSYSFPSGHAMNSVVFYALFARHIFHFTRKSELGFIIAFCSLILIFLIGFSRIYLGVHYLSDVLAGFTAGFWIVITAILMERTVAFYKMFRRRQTVKK